MDNKLTSEKLNALSKEALVLMILSMQDQLTQLNSKMDSLMEQISVSNNYRFGRSGFSSLTVCPQVRGVAGMHTSSVRNCWFVSMARLMFT